MKHKLAIATIVIMAMVIPSTIMAQGNKPRTSPDKAKYSIVGTMNYRNGERWLDNPVGNTPQAFADHIVKLLESEELRDTIARNGNQFVHQHFSWEQSCEKLSEVLRGVCENKR